MLSKFLFGGLFLSFLWISKPKKKSQAIEGPLPRDLLNPSSQETAAYFIADKKYFQ